jgi:hypothetical protein
MAPRRARHHNSLTRVEINAKCAALLAEGKALEREYDRLRFSPADSPNHAAHSECVRRHSERVRRYLDELRRTQDDEPATRH